MFVYYNNRRPKQSSLDFWQEKALVKAGENLEFY